MAQTGRMRLASLAILTVLCVGNADAGGPGSRLLCSPTVNCREWLESQPSGAKHLKPLPDFGEIDQAPLAPDPAVVEQMWRDYQLNQQLDEINHQLWELRLWQQ